MIGNYVIFRLVRDRLAQEMASLSKDLKWKMTGIHLKVKQSRILKRFLPLVAGLIFASPLPDEIAVAMLGASHYDAKKFLLYSFVFHFAGFMVIGYAGEII
jgi:hypothetical protein